MSVDILMKKWKPVLDHADMPAIRDVQRRKTVSQLLENQLTGGMAEGMLNEALPANVSADFGGPNSNNTTNISGYDPIMISLVRRAMPNLIAYDICGVQAMSGPTGLIFAARSKYATDTSLLDDTEAFYNEVNSAYSGTGTQTGTTPAVLNQATPGPYTRGTGVATSVGEDFGDTTAIGKMGLTIEKVTVTAKTRALEAGYTVELAEDLKRIHGLNAEAELSTMLSTELLAEINREVVRTVYIIAKPGAQNTTTPGIFDLNADSSGRWAVEKFKSLKLQIDRDCNQISKETRMGKGNILICSSDVASALSLAGVLDIPMDNSRAQLQVDDTGNTFAGVLDGRIKVYIDPYSPTSQSDDGQFYVVGYKGPNPMDAGLFYCPYIPLQMFKVQDVQTYQPKIMFKTRYGLVANPYAGGATIGLGALTANQNVFYRRIKVLGLLTV